MKLLIRILHRDFRAILYRISYIPLKRQYPTHFYFSPQLVFISLRRTISLLFSREKCKSKIRCLPLLLPLPSPHSTNNATTQKKTQPTRPNTTHTIAQSPTTKKPASRLFCPQQTYPGYRLSIFQKPYLPIYFH